MEDFRRAGHRQNAGEFLAKLERGAGPGRGKTFNTVLNVSPSSEYKEVLDENGVGFTAGEYDSRAQVEI